MVCRMPFCSSCTVATLGLLCVMPVGQRFLHQQGVLVIPTERRNIIQLLSRWCLFKKCVTRKMIGDMPPFDTNDRVALYPSLRFGLPQASPNNILPYIPRCASG